MGDTGKLTQDAVESSGLDAFLKDTAAERARGCPSLPGSRPSLNFTDTLALTLTVQTNPLQQANQVPVSVLSCSGRSNPTSSTPVPLAGLLVGWPFVVTQQIYSSSLPVQTKPAQQPQRTTATNQRSDDRPGEAPRCSTTRARASEPSSEREFRTPGARVPPDDAETRSHGRDVRARREGSASQPRRPTCWTHPRETTGRSLPRSPLQVGGKCAGEPTGRRATTTDGRVGRSSSEEGAQGGRTGSAGQRYEGSPLLRNQAGHHSMDLRSFSTAATNRGLVDSPRSQDTGTSAGLPTGRFCSQDHGGQASYNSWPLGRYPPAPRARRDSASARALPGTRETRRIDYALSCTA